MAAALGVAVVFAFALVTDAFADPTIAPHVAINDDTDSCAMCHRAHTSASGVTTTDQLGTERNALVVGNSPAGVGDTQLCYSCHGWAGVGAIAADVQEDFEKLSFHVIAPEDSDYGPSPKQCGSCHDPHGTARNEFDEPYAALLRVVKEGLAGVYQGDEYCAACHEDRPADVWDGIEIWQQTAHADVTATASGTEIVCSVCHAPHGSNNTALVVETLYPPSAPATVTVQANDRSVCFGCHPGSLATYSGATVYDASSHGSTEETVVAATEWASRVVESEDTTRLAGECQVCHSPMGTDDGSGAPIAKLANAEGAALCYRCHDGEMLFAADIESLYPTITAGAPEIVTAYGATAGMPQFGLAQVYSRESTTSGMAPSPRQALEGQVGPLVTGDIDGHENGLEEALVVRRGSTTVSIIRSSELAGLAVQDVQLLAVPTHIAIGDVVSDPDNLNEVIAVERDGANSIVRVYRWQDSMLTMVPSAATTVTGTVSGIATGDVLGTDHDDIVVTTHVPNGLHVIDGGSGALVLQTLTLNGPSSLPQGPSVGDIDGAPNGKAEIAIALGGQTSPTIALYGSTGFITSGGTTGSNQIRAQRTLIHDVLWGAPAASPSSPEVIVSFADPADGNQDGARADLFPQSGVALLAPVSYTLPQYSNPAEMTAGDVDGDGHDELLVARAGSFRHLNAPGLSVVHANGTGTGIAGDDFYPAAGVEAADSGPGPAWVAIAELGEVGTSKHAVGTVPGAHVSTETIGFARHVECVDCHNVHEATSTPSPAAPAAYGSIKGTWGVSLDLSVQKQGIENEYELCLKCHDELAAEIGPSAASSHPVTGPSLTSEALAITFVGPATVDSVLFCIDCHGNSDDLQPVGPHVSAQAPLLLKPYWGTLPGETPLIDPSQHLLCYKCHKYEVYYTGAEDVTAGSRFWKNNAPRRLHLLHGGTNGIGCSACHNEHGAGLPHLIRGDVGYVHVPAGGGSCTNSCHSKGTNTYSGR